MADFLIGDMVTRSVSALNTPTICQSLIGLYIQDTARVNSHLTINVGLRWEPTPFPQDLFHRGASFSLANFLAGTPSNSLPGAPARASDYGDSGVSPPSPATAPPNSGCARPGLGSSR